MMVMMGVQEHYNMNIKEECESERSRFNTFLASGKWNIASDFRLIIIGETCRGKRTQHTVNRNGVDFRVINVCGSSHTDPP